MSSLDSYFLSSAHGITVTTLSMFTTKLAQFSVHSSIFLFLDALDERPFTLPVSEAKIDNKVNLFLKNTSLVQQHLL